MKWSEMQPHDRDALVAEKVMGWKPGICDGEIGEQSCSPDGWFCHKCGQEGYWGDDMEHEELPQRYTVSMDRAWLIMDHLKPRRAGDISTEDQDTFMRRAVFVSILENRSDRWWSWSKERLCAEICLASLRAVGVEVEA